MSQPIEPISSHPADEQLLQFALQPQDGDESIRMHLATCKSCRGQVGLMMRLKNHADALSAAPVDEARQQPVNDLIYGDVTAA